MPKEPLIDVLTNAPLLQGGVMALGNFDGVHLGHRAVIAAAAEKARALGAPCLAMTFEPHPYAFFQKEKKPFRLTSAATKARLLKEAGADHVVTLPFSPALASFSAAAFVQEILIEACAVRHVVVGFNFVFGAGRSGDRAVLQRGLTPLGIGVSEVPPLLDETGEPLSSSRIREALAAGRPEQARAWLGRPFALEGEILLGDKRGRELAFPTANMTLGLFVRPRFGVYAVTARRVGDDMVWRGVANIGVRPTIGDEKELLEFHLFDFSGEIYGESWSVELHAFLRPERKFVSLDELRAQIFADAQAAKQALTN